MPRFAYLLDVRFRLEQRIAAPVEAVEAALLDPDFVAATAALPKLAGPEIVERRRDGDHALMRVRYRFTGHLSSAVTAVVDRDRLTWIDEATYDLAGHRSNHRIVPDHYPGRLQASYVVVLEPDADGTHRVATGEVRVRMALVGRRVERAIVSGLDEHARAEARLLERWCTKRP
jgi:hypothetical protein